MKRDTRLYLDDIVESANLIEEYLKGITEEQFHRSKEKQDSVVRRIEIIGEATRNIPDEFRQQYPYIPWKKMAGIRNVLIHEYFGINWNTVWQTAKEFIPPLKKDIISLIKSGFN